MVPSMRVPLHDDSSDDDDNNGRAISESSSESNSEYTGADYSIPVRCDSKQASSKSFSAANPIALESTQMSEGDPEFVGEIAGAMNHHYHLLDVMLLIPFLVDISIVVVY